MASGRNLCQGQKNLEVSLPCREFDENTLDLMLSAKLNLEVWSIKLKGEV